MNGDINAEAPRPRPLSGGIWTLFSWLRRDERSFSNESLSSAGSDRTAVSFAFLEPLHYSAATEPIILPPPSPPTDSYRKRVRDRNFRKQRERDITLHRKYGLFKGENTDRFDAFSLPTARKNITSSGDKIERGRRAASESFQRRAPYVPGKRRAPLPPAVTTSLPRNFSRKKPAPQPPIKLTEIAKENIKVGDNRCEPMNSTPDCDTPTNSVSKEIKIQKNTKQEKIKSDRSFLKQIFENRKRNSATVTNYAKLLPNISELDKQAAKIIENKKLKALEVSSPMPNSSKYSMKLIASEAAEEKWICTKCFRKYNTAMSSCLYCIPDQKEPKGSFKNKLNIPPNIASNIYTQTDNELANVASPNPVSGHDEKKKLKEMLKEMKDSLPKRAKHNIFLTESPTLRIGYTPTHKDKLSVDTESSSENETIINSADKLKLQRDNEADAFNPPSNLTSDVVVIKNCDFSQPSSSGITKKNPVIDLTSPIQSKNRGPYCELSVSNKTVLPSDVKFDKLNTEMKKGEYCPNPQATKQIFNIPVTNMVPKNTNQMIIKENVPNSLLKSEHCAINKRMEIVNEDTIKNSQLKQQFSINCSNKNSSSNKTESRNICDITVSEPPRTQHPALNTAVRDSSLSEKDTKQEQNKENITKLNPEILLAKITNKHSGRGNNNVNKQSTFNDRIINFTADNVTAIAEVPDNRLNVDKLKTTITSSADALSLHTPLKISSLLNPVHRPIQSNCVTKETSENINETTKLNVIPLMSTEISQPSPKVLLNPKPLQPIKEISETNLKDAEEKELKSLSSSILNDYNTNSSVCKVLGVIPSLKETNWHSKAAARLDHHSRRREIVNQLEQSIAKGDEKAAADAAIKLAKLRLSCSVLSFTSQIVGNLPTTSKTVEPITKPKENKIKSESIQKSTQVRIDARSTSANNSLSEKSQLAKSLNKNSQNNDKPPTSTVGGRDKKNLTVEMITIKDNIPSNSTALKHNPAENGSITIQIWVEDKEATRGPISLRIPRQAIMGELRRQAEATLGLDSRLQRWIIGRTLCLDDSTPLVSLAGPNLSAPFYLCLVESETKKETARGLQEQNQEKETKKSNDNTGEVYTELMKLEQQAIVPNTETFECGVCMEECVAGRGAVLRECIHTFCRDCLSDVVRHCEEPIVYCPATGCPGILQEREIRALLTTEEYERWLARGLATAECGTRNAFHCRTRDCTGWALCEPGVKKFPCPVCKCNNCVPCQAIHEGETCEQYQVKLRSAVTAVQSNETDEGTQALLNSLIRRGEALECPECHAIITKKWGCDWVKCSACKTEICWVTRGRRWGPGGRGDTSAGCKCGVDGKRCHPSCGYCH